MSGVEPEFRQMFAEDAATRLDRMGEQLLELERDPAQPELLADVFREAHSLKGGAGMVGFERVSTTAHAMEDLLQQLRSRRLLATPAITDALLAAVDGIRTLVRLSVEGSDETAEATISERLIQRLQATAGGTNGSAEPQTAPPADEQPSFPVAAPARVQLEAATMQISRISRAPARCSMVIAATALPPVASIGSTMIAVLFDKSGGNFA